MTVSVDVDPVRCTGHGLCALLLDERITLDEWGFPHVDPAPVTGRAEKKARRAARACPRRALLLRPPVAGAPLPTPSGATGP